MCERKDDEKMNSTFSKRKAKGLTKSKKEQLKIFVGKSSSKIDFKKVRDEWK